MSVSDTSTPGDIVLIRRDVYQALPSIVHQMAVDVLVQRGRCRIIDDETRTPGGGARV